MIDSIKLAIPLTRNQHRKISEASENSDKAQWVLYHPQTGEMWFRRISGAAKTDGESFHRELRWDIPATYFDDCYLTIEFSIPKFWYGHNIHLLYDFMPALNHLRDLLNQAFHFRTRGILPPVEHWGVHRLDVCYAWRFPDQKTVSLFMDSLKHLHFPRKKPTIHPTGISFKGATYSAKVYLKLDEFKPHDRKTMINDGVSLEYVNHLESLAEGVIRFEVLLRRRWLKRNGINTVADLLRPDAYLEWDEDMAFPENFNEDGSIFVVLEWEMYENGFDPSLILDPDRHTEIADGTRLSAPKGIYDLGDVEVHHPEGGFTYRKQARVLSILQTMLEKFIGKETQMLKADEVKAKLLEHYKEVKAARLTAFWLYVHQFGLEKARDDYGERSYYASKRDLKAAGVSLVGRPKTAIPQSAEFLTRFRMEIPSADVTNKFDDYRDRSNVLNFVLKASNM